MTAKKDEESKRLAQEKKEKNRLAKNAIDFFNPITGKNGKRHTCGNFCSRVKKGPPLVGGNTIEVWYRKRPVPVLKFWWQFDIEKGKFEKFDTDQKWQTALLESIERKKANETQAKKIIAACKKESVLKKKDLTIYEQEQREQHRARKEKGLYAL